MDLIPPVSSLGSGPIPRENRCDNTVVKMHDTLQIWEATSEMVSSCCISLDICSENIHSCISTSVGLAISFDGSNAISSSHDDSTGVYITIEMHSV
jgi:hypothetical protein